MNHARDSYPYARDLADLVASGVPDDGGASISSLIEEATKAQHGRVYSDEDIATTPELTGHTALYIGFAACWLLMNEMGRERAL
jgi:hypothetical protein